MDNSQYSFENIKQISTTEVIVQNLIKLISEKKLVPGDKLPSERVLCEMIGISRPLLREALKALQVMKIISIRQGAGAYVRNLRPENIIEHLDIVFHLDSSLYHDLYEARRILEGSVAGIAASNITDEEIQTIEQNIQYARQAIDDAELFFKLDLELHEIVLRASRNRIMPVFTKSVNKLSLIMREQTNAHRHIRQSAVEDHEKILYAMKIRDPAAARRAMESHISHVEQGFSAHMANEPLKAAVVDDSALPSTEFAVKAFAETVMEGK
jgi:GntR family transcriptional repressor for pyruvate dehydrogenase complex